MALLVVNIGLCVWVAWCFKEQKFPVVWPIKVGHIGNMALGAAGEWWARVGGSMARAMYGA